MNPGVKKTRPRRVDQVGEHRTALRKNKKIIMQTQELCAICGLPVDKTLKTPDPMSPTVDHIIPVAKGGHPSELANLQLAHRCCNLQKSDKLYLAGGQIIPGTQQDPGMQKAPGSQDNPGSQSNQGGKNSPGVQKTARVSNDILPQHVDWSTYTW